MPDARRIRRPKEFDELLAKLKKEEVFLTHKDALIFAASYGFRNGKSMSFEASGEPINIQVFNGEYDRTIIACLALAKEGDVSILSKDREGEKYKIFEEYACGGLELLKNEIEVPGFIWEKELVSLILSSEKNNPDILGDISNIDI